MSIEHKVAVAVLLDFRKNDHGEVLVTYRGSSHDIHVVEAIPFLRVVNLELIRIENEVPPRPYPGSDLMTNAFDVITEGDDEVGVPVICKEAVVLFMRLLIKEIEDGISVTYGVPPSRPTKHTQRIPYEISEEREEHIKKDIEFLTREVDELLLCDPLEYRPFRSNDGYEEMGFLTENDELDPESEEGREYRKKAHRRHIEVWRREIAQKSEVLRVLVKTRESFLRLDRGEEVATESEAIEESSEQTNPQETIPGSDSANILRHLGGIWLIRFQGKQTFGLPDSLGLFYLSVLIQNQGKAISAKKLSELAAEGLASRRELGDPYSLAAENDGLTVSGPAAGIVGSDAKAEKAYKKRAEELLEEISEAERRGDSYAVEELRDECEKIREHLRKDRGLRGRKRFINNEGAAFRTKVSNAVTRAIDEIYKQDQDCGSHLREYYDGGYDLSYAPKEPIPWDL